MYSNIILTFLPVTMENTLHSTISSHIPKTHLMSLTKSHLIIKYHKNYQTCQTSKAFELGRILYHIVGSILGKDQLGLKRCACGSD